jgi:hypothetical protein
MIRCSQHRPLAEACKGWQAGLQLRLYQGVRHIRRFLDGYGTYPFHGGCNSLFTTQNGVQTGFKNLARPTRLTPSLTLGRSFGPAHFVRCPLARLMCCYTQPTRRARVELISSNVCRAAETKKPLRWRDLLLFGARCAGCTSVAEAMDGRERPRQD